MKAGRELDQLVAEKIMGWRKHAVEGYWHNAPTDQLYDASWIGGSNLGTYDYCWFDLDGFPRYSTCIARAWEVVERADQFEMHGSIGDGPYRAWLSFADKDEEASALSMPLAICLAALKAVGHDVTSS